MKLNHPIHAFHLVTYSPWPVGASIASLIMTLGLVLSMNNYTSIPLIIGIILVISTFVLWFNDILTEAALMGQNTSYVSRSITIGFILFMISEIFLFGSLFWAFFHSALNPAIELGNSWPPIGIKGVDSRELPLTNTIILLTTGATITAAHNQFFSKNNNYKKIVNYIGLTIVLLIMFMGFQYLEYYYAQFTITDSVFGSVFFMTTSLHFLHILVVTIYLTLSLVRITKNQIINLGSGSFDYCVVMLRVYDLIWVIIYIFYYIWTGE